MSAVLNYIKKNPLLALVVLLGVLLRVINLNIGSPILYLSNDEAIYHISALNMLAEKTPFSLGNYGPLGSYVQLPFLVITSLIFLALGIVNSYHELQLLLITHEGLLLFVPRGISAFFGVMTILLTYYFTKCLFKKNTTAILAAFFAAVSFNLVHISHLARAWSPALFFVLLSAFLSYRGSYISKEKEKFIVLAYLSSAIGFGFHQLSGVSIILIILIRLFSQKFRISKVDLYGSFLWLATVSLMIFLSVGGDFLSIANPQTSSAGLMKIPKNISELGFKGTIDYLLMSSHYISFAKEIFLSDGLLALLGVIFLIKNFRKNNLAPFLIYLVIGMVLSVYVYISLIRYFLPIFVFLPIFAAAFIESLGKHKWLRVVLPAILLLSLSNSLIWNYLIVQKPTFMQLRDFLDLNIPQDRSIAVTERRNFDYVPISSAAEAIRKVKPLYYHRAEKIVGNNYYPNVRNVIYVNEFEMGSKNENLQKAMGVYKIEYVVDSYWNGRDRLLNDDPNLELIAHFSPTGNVIYDKDIPSILFDSGSIFNTDFTYSLTAVDRPGPYFDVLKIKN